MIESKLYEKSKIGTTVGLTNRFLLETATIIQPKLYMDGKWNGPLQGWILYVDLKSKTAVNTELSF